MKLFGHKPPKIKTKNFEEDLQVWIHKPTCVLATQLIVAFRVDTLEGTMTGKAGDYLVKGTAGEFYIVDKTIFENIYKNGKCK